MEPNKTTAKKLGPLSTYFVQGMIAVAEVTDDVILDVTIYRSSLTSSSARIITALFIGCCIMLLEVHCKKRIAIIKLLPARESSGWGRENR